MKQPDAKTQILLRGGRRNGNLPRIGLRSLLCSRIPCSSRSTGASFVLVDPLKALTLSKLLRASKPSLFCRQVTSVPLFLRKQGLFIMSPKTTSSPKTSVPLPIFLLFLGSTVACWPAHTISPGAWLSWGLLFPAQLLPLGWILPFIQKPRRSSSTPRTFPQPCGSPSLLLTCNLCEHGGHLNFFNSQSLQVCLRGPLCWNYLGRGACFEIKIQGCLPEGMSGF